MNEIWKDIKGDEGLYQISNFGKVKRKNRILKNRKISQYKGVALSKEGKVKNYTIHRLVAQAFIDNPKNKKEVNHIDGNKDNNMVNNLEWVTRQENQQHAYDTGLCAVRLGKDNKHSKKILQIDIHTHKIINIFYGTGDIRRKYGYHYSAIIKCCNNQRKTAYNFIWQYK